MKFYDVVPGLDFMEEYDLEQSPAWFLDATHSVPPWTPMFGWFWINFCRHGMQYGAETLSLPTVKGWDWRFKDGGGYLTLLMVDSDKEKAEREKKFREAIRPFVENYDGLWGGYVKEILKRYENLKALDVNTASNIKLLENFEETIDTCRRMWEIHMHMMYGTYTPYVLFEQLCMQLLNIDDTHPTFHKLVAGFDNESFRVDRRLWEFSKKAKDMGLEGLFKETPSKQMTAKLGSSDKGKTYLKEFNNFLDKEAGWRMERMAEINVPTWQEDPTPGYETVKMYLKKGGDFDLDQDRKKIEKERKDTEKEVLGKIAPEQKGWFSMLMKVAQNCSRFSEEHNHYLDLYTHALMRRSCMALGNRFAKCGAINQPGDIFFLMPDEVRKAGINPDKLNLKPIVQRRQKEWEEWNQKGNPPAIFKEGFTLEMAIGGLVQSLDPIALKVVVGSMPVPKPELKADLLGTCGSSGMAEGIARVVLRDEDLPTIQKGDILVAMSTSPAWTPVFSMISGVVVDRGASLSHAAIVGREYGIPVVMNVFTGTQVIKSGQRIRVDGNLGPFTSWINDMPPQKKTQNIIWFKNCSSKDFSQVGGKNANLGEMFQLGLRVPPGFAVTTHAFDTFIERGRVRNKIVRTLSQIPPEDIHALEGAGRQIRDLIESTPIPGKISKEIKEAYQKLGALCGIPDLPVAVRSSATSEDLKTASFAGQHESYLWVRGEEEVVQHILKCWASLFTDRAIAYRNQIGWPHDKVTISVGVQKMVNAKCAGVMFTIDPVIGDENKIVVEGNWGLGESVVKGEVSPDHFLVDKQSSKILEKNVALKLVCYQLEGNKVVCTPPSIEKQNQLCLNDEELVEIARLGKISEAHYESAQDLEWAIDVDLPFPENVFLVQTRPVTSSGKPKQSNTDIIIDMMSSLFRR